MNPRPHRWRRGCASSSRRWPRRCSSCSSPRSLALATGSGIPLACGQLAIVVWLVTVPTLLPRLGERLGHRRHRSGATATSLESGRRRGRHRVRHPAHHRGDRVAQRDRLLREDSSHDRALRGRGPGRGRHHRPARRPQRGRPAHRRGPGRRVHALRHRRRGSRSQCSPARQGTFCAGADLKAMSEPSGERINSLSPDGDGPMGPTRMSLTKPVIAAVEGHAVAGGLELALWCDLRVAAEGAVFGVFCRRWGVPLVDGGTVRLPRIIGQGPALDLILTGRAVRRRRGAASRPGDARRADGQPRATPRSRWRPSSPPCRRCACATTARRSTRNGTSPSTPRCGARPSSGSTPCAHPAPWTAPRASPPAPAATAPPPPHVTFWRH